MKRFGSFSLSEVFVKTVSSNLAARKKILLDINQNFRGTVSFSKNDQLSLLKDGGRLEGERRRGFQIILRLPGSGSLVDFINNKL